MKRLLLIMAAAMTLTSCGRTVRPTGENGDIKHNSQQRTEHTTEPETEAVTEQDEPAEPTAAVRPDPVKADTKMPEDHELKRAFEISGFEPIMQCPELPTGCEVTALAEVLNYCGFSIDKVELCDKFLPVDPTGVSTFSEAYVGDPRWDDGFGCYAPVIVRTANDYFDCIGSDWYAIDLTGISFDELLYQVEQGRPVIVWTTIDQVICYPQYYPQIDAEFNGMQHCLAVFGYNMEGGTVHCADPLEGNMAYNMERFSQIYDILGKQAVILVGNEETAGAEFSDEAGKKAWLEKNRPDPEETKEENQ